jgi:hypothetical protein
MMLHVPAAMPGDNVPGVPFEILLQCNVVQCLVIAVHTR